MSKEEDRPRAAFATMEASTAADWRIIGAEFVRFGQGLADRVLKHLALLDGDYGGFPVDRLTHSLQTATLAHDDGRDEEYVVCALLHDIGDTLGSYNHPDVAAAIVKPFVSDELHWMVEKHAIFQGYYFFHFLGLDRDMRDQFVGHPYFDITAEFTADFDQPAFDPDYPTMTLDDFTPLLQQFFSSPKRSIYLREE